MDPARIWSIYDRDDRLVLVISDQPGEFNFARLPDEGADPVECDFATLQCYTPKVEPEVLNLLFRCADVEEFLDRMKKRGFKVRAGRPRPYRFARL